MMNPFEEYPIIGEMRSAIEEDLRSTINLSFSDTYYELRDMLSYHMGWMDDFAQGKRIRPILLLLITQALDMEWKNTIPAASAIELIHNFSLIHDDIQDHSEIRHGRPTLWKTVGVAQAINAGDALFTIGLKKVWDLQKGFNLDLVSRISLILNQTCLRLTQGQYLDISFEGRSQISDRDYLEMIAGKTTALLSTCTQIGAMVAGTSSGVVLSAVEYGRNLGMAFQIVDDYLGIWGDPGVIGKSAAIDLVNRKKTYPVLLGLASENRFSKRWNAGPISEAEAPIVAKLLEETGSKSVTIQKADEYTQKALANLSDLSSNARSRQVLEDLTIWLLKRDL